MRILLVAHDFPPIPSPQSLRWAYLVRELSALGHDIHVLAPDHPGYGPTSGLPTIPPEVTVHRTFPGLFTWSVLAQTRLRRSSGRSTTAAEAEASSEVGVTAGLILPTGPLNWKGRTVEWLRRQYARMLFPDVRAEWTPWASRALPDLLAGLRPDLVIASHEPPGPLTVGLRARRQGYRVVADLGDPVCAPYTPSRWRRRAIALERRICLECDLVTVTSQGTASLLQQRHGISKDRFFVLTQGFDADLQSEQRSPRESTDGATLELLYTGSFYEFRDPSSLLSALTMLSGVRLSIASSNVPSVVKDAARARPDSLRLLGFLPHRSVLELQRRADVLVNIANADPVQVPGKVYEYLGAGRPILHIGNEPMDEALALVQRLGVGNGVADCANDIAEMLTGMHARLPEIRQFKSSTAPLLIGQYAWSALARRLAERITALPSENSN